MANLLAIPAGIVLGLVVLALADRLPGRGRRR